MMASSSGKGSICANRKCLREMVIPRPGWRNTRWNVQLCNQCFIAFRKKQFCNIYHKDSRDWRTCIVCDKKIHHLCYVSKDWYTTSDAGEIICNGCAPPSETMVPQTLVANNEMSDEELPPPPKAIKRHHGHGTGCMCVVCSQPASGSKHDSSCVSTASGKKAPKTTLPTSQSGQSGDVLFNKKKLVIRSHVNIIVPPEPKKPKTANRSGGHPNANRGLGLDSTNHSGGHPNANSGLGLDSTNQSGGHPNANSGLGLDSKNVSFDLNLPPEADEDFMDIQ